MTYMDLKKLDVMALQDTILSLSESNRLAGLIRRRYLINVQVRIAPVPVEQNTPRDQRVGGQMIIILGKWANRVINFIKDPTQQGVATGLYLRTGPKRHLLILSSYWPIPATDPTSGALE